MKSTMLCITGLSSKTSSTNHNILRNFPRILLTWEPEHQQYQELRRDPHVHAVL